MTTPRITKQAVSLIDCITPENKLVKIKVVNEGRGLRFTFAEKVLPSWVFDVAHRLRWVVCDLEPSILQGRVIEITANETKTDKKRNFNWRANNYYHEP